jgi:hypothetical protein
LKKADRKKTWKCEALAVLVRDISTRDYKEFSTDPSAARFLECKDKENPPSIESAVNLIMHDLVPLWQLVNRLEDAEMKAKFEALYLEIDHRADDPFNPYDGYYLLSEKLKNGYWYKNNYSIARNYYQHYIDGETVKIDIENIDAISAAREELLPHTSFFIESSQANGAPRTILAAIALHNVLFKSKALTYSLIGGLDGVAQTNSIGALRRFCNQHRYSPYDIGFQDRFADYFGGVIAGATPTTGIMQIRAGETFVEGEKNVKADKLWERLGINPSNWSNRKINYYLYFFPKYSIEAGAVLWKQMIASMVESQENNKVNFGMPDLTSFSNGEWIANSSDCSDYPLCNIYGPDLFAELLNSPINYYETDLQYRTLIKPFEFMLNATVFVQERSYSSLHRVILQSGLFSDKKAVIVGISDINQIDKINDLLNSEDEFLRGAARRTVCEIADAEEGNQFKNRITEIGIPTDFCAGEEF